MGLTSLQVCMGTSEWLEKTFSFFNQGRTIHEESGLDSSPSNGEMIPCSRPLIERRLRPQHDQALKCPRCDSTHTKFCYYNNYSLSQPRYFCKTCRRYWTKGGSLRNVPVGGGCRKNKRVATRKPTTDNPLNQNQNFSSPHDVTDLQLSSYSGMQLTQLNTIMASHANPNFMDSKYSGMLGNPRDHEFNGILGNPRNIDFMGYSDMGHGFTSCYPYGFSLDVKHGTVLDSCERLVTPFDSSDDVSMVEMKPSSNKMLSLEWEEQGCSQVGKDSFGYMNGLGSWSGMINGYGSSATNQLV